MPARRSASSAGCDDFDLLVPEVTGFAGVRIESAHEDARRTQAEARRRS